MNHENLTYVVPNEAVLRVFLERHPKQPVFLYGAWKKRFYERYHKNPPLILHESEAKSLMNLWLEEEGCSSEEASLWSSSLLQSYRLSRKFGVSPCKETSSSFLSFEHKFWEEMLFKFPNFLKKKHRIYELDIELSLLLELEQEGFCEGIKKKWVFFGFEDIVGAQKNLFEVLVSKGLAKVEKNVILEKIITQKSFKTSVSNLSLGYQLMCIKAKQLMEQGKRVGFWVNDLSVEYEAVYSALLEHFSKESFKNIALEHQGKWLDEPMVRALLSICRLNFGTLLGSEVLNLLHSPFFHPEKNIEELRLLWKKKSSFQDRFEGFEVLKYFGLKTSKKELNHLQALLDSAFLLGFVLPSKKEEERFLSLVAYLSSQNIFSKKKIHWSRLESALKETSAPFQTPQKTLLSVFSSPNHKISSFDTLFVSNFEVPKLLSNVPWIPRELQKSFKMPGVNLKKDSEESMEIILSLFAKTKNIHFLYLEGSELHAPMDWLSCFEKATEEAFILPKLEESAVFEEDMKEEALSLLPLGEKKGGVSLLNATVSCFLKAQFLGRLRAKEEEKAKERYDIHRIRGNALHDYLEHFFGTEKEESEKKNHLSRFLDKELKARNLGISPLDEAQRDYEFSWVYSRAEPFLKEYRFLSTKEEDKERKVSLDIKGHTFSIRLDRIDRDQEGGAIILDFKSKGFELNHALSLIKIEEERPKECQLWVYFLAVPEAKGVMGVYFGEKKKAQKKDQDLDPIVLWGQLEEPLLELFHSTKNELSFKLEAWDSSIEKHRLHVKEVLESRFLSYTKGSSQADPVQSSVCQFCGYQMLCRLEERKVKF